ncbi:MAG: hypothetical protein UMS36scaffold28_52 [Phage 59_13]|nr:MAG: hypothetical protein UMS36scaffold28_52 [Phage 59_13]
MPNNNKAEIESEVLWVISSRESERGGTGTELRVVRWIIDGKPAKPLLEKRDWFASQDGEIKPGKARGLNSFDLAKIVMNVRKIAHLMEMKDDHLDEALQLANQPWMEKAPEKKPAAKPQPSAKASAKPADPEPQPEGTAPETTF